MVKLHDLDFILLVHRTVLGCVWVLFVSVATLNIGNQHPLVN